VSTTKRTHGRPRNKYTKRARPVRMDRLPTATSFKAIADDVRKGYAHFMASRGLSETPDWMMGAPCARNIKESEPRDRGNIKRGDMFA